MKAYGLPRNSDIDSPDKIDLVTYGRKSSIGHLPKKCGKYPNSLRSSSAKRSIRRYYKKLQRKYNHMLSMSME